MKQIKFFFFFIILSKYRDRLLTLEMAKESNLKNIISINYDIYAKSNFYEYD